MNRAATFGAAALFVVSVVAGAVVSSGMSGAEVGERVLPATEEPVPVLGPVAFGPEPPSSQTSGGGGGVLSQAISVLEPVATASDGAVEPDAGLFGIGGGPGDAVEPLGLPAGSAGVVSGPHFEDPCSVPSVACGLPGVGATVLGGDDDPEGEGGTVGEARAGLHDAPPLWVRIIDPDGPGNPWTSRCDADDVPRGELALTIVSLNPADLTIEYRTEDDAMTSALSASSAGRSHPERRRWQRWFDDGTLNSAPDRRVQHCLSLPALPDGAAYYVVSVTATDIFGQVATHRETIQPGDPTSRPGTIVTPIDDTHLAVRAAALVDPAGAFFLQDVRIRMVPGTGEDATTCAAVEEGGFRRSPGEVYALSDGGEVAEVGDVEGSEYRYRAAEVFNVFEGTQYWVCLWWTRPGSRSFDPERIDEREQHTVTSPSHWNLLLELEGITPSRDIDAGGVKFDVEAAGRPFCRAIVDRPLRDSIIPDFDLAICDPVGSVDGHGLGPLPTFLPLYVTGPEGKVLDYYIHPPDGPCSPGGGCLTEVEQWYAVTIPNHTAVRRLCGSAFGGDPDPDCAVPNGRESAGSALLHATFLDLADDGGTSWDLGSSPSAFTVAPSGIEPLPLEPRLDLRASGVSPDADAPHDLYVSFAADRPVTVTGFVTDEHGNPPCLRSGDGTFAVVTPSLRVTTRIDGLCANTRYAVTMVLTDPVGGGTATYGQGLGPSGLPWLNRGTTAGFDVILDVQVSFRELPGAGNEALVTRHQLLVDHRRLFYFDESERPIHDSRCVEIDFGSSTADFNAAWPLTVGDEVRVFIAFQAYGDRDEGCPPGGRVSAEHIRADASVDLTVPIEALLEPGGVYLDTVTDDREDTIDLRVDVRATLR